MQKLLRALGPGARGLLFLARLALGAALVHAFGRAAALALPPHVRLAARLALGPVPALLPALALATARALILAILVLKVRHSLLLYGRDGLNCPTPPSMQISCRRPTPREFWQGACFP